MKNYINSFLLFGVLLFVSRECLSDNKFGTTRSGEEVKQCQQKMECFCTVFANVYQAAADLKSGGEWPGYISNFVGDDQKVLTEKVMKFIINDVQHNLIIFHSDGYSVGQKMGGFCASHYKKFKPLK